MKRLRIALKAAVLDLPSRWRDARLNRRLTTAARRFLVVRHAAKQPYRHRYFLDWVERVFPQVRARFELRLLPCIIHDWSPYVLHVPWLQDPVEDWTPCGYRQAMELGGQCHGRGIPVINRVERLSNSVKSVGARLIAGAGVRTPRIVPIENWATFRETLGGLELPLLIREDRGHGQLACLVERRTDLDRLPPGRFAHSMAAEYIDVRSPEDGMYRKYRYLAVGDRGVTRHLMSGNHWEVRPGNRLVNAATKGEELAYLSAPEPHHAALQRARRALGFDVAAFDYSYDRQGQLVVWEANPYPDLSYPANPLMTYSFPYVERSFAAVVRLYLQRAGLPVPAKLEDMLAGQDGPAIDYKTCGVAA